MSLYTAVCNECGFRVEDESTDMEAVTDDELNAISAEGPPECPQCGAQDWDIE